MQSEAEHSMAYLEISNKRGNGIDFTKCAITRESRRVDKPRDRGEEAALKDECYSLALVVERCMSFRSLLSAVFERESR